MRGVGAVQITKELQHDTFWLRIVQIGHGQKLWRQLVKGRGLCLVDSLSAAERMYVQIPPRFAADQIIEVLSDVNIEVLSTSVG